jgi:CubicO group peptidase (beta-lactamase class C family)
MWLRAIFVSLAVLTPIIVPQTAWASETSPLRDPVRLEELQRSLEELRRLGRVPGLGVAIVDSEGPIAVEGMGFADLAENRGVEAGTVFALGSLGQAAIALAVLKLAEEERVYLQVQIRELIPEIDFHNPWDYRHPLRLDHLLEHSGGLEEIQPHGWRSEDFDLNDPVSVRRLTAGSRVARWEPGAFSAPSGVGPAVAAYAISRMVGGEFERWVTDNLFEPLGMATASFGLHSTRDGGPKARGYLPGGEPVSTRLADEIPPPSLHASVRDLANLLEALVQRGAFRGVRVVTEKSLERMETPSTTPTARQAIQVGQGFGIRARVSEGFLFHGLESTVPGGWAAFAYLAAEGRGFAVVANGGSRETHRRVAVLLRRYLVQGLEPPRPLLLDLPERRLAALTGYYRLETHRWEKLRFLDRVRQVVHVRSDAGRLIVTSPRGHELQFFPVTDRRFRGEGEPLPTLLFASGPLGRPVLYANSDRLSGGFIWASGVAIWLERILAALGLGLVLGCLVSGPARLAWDLTRSPGRPTGALLLLGPFLAAAVLSLGGLAALASSEEWVGGLGRYTVWSGIIYVSSLLYPLLAGVSPVMLVGFRHRAGRGYLLYVSMVCMAGLVLAGYFTYWGVIGLRTWE